MTMGGYEFVFSGCLRQSLILVVRFLLVVVVLMGIETRALLGVGCMSVFYGVYLGSSAHIRRL
jgi:hypothetical protein